MAQLSGGFCRLVPFAGARLQAPLAALHSLPHFIKAPRCPIGLRAHPPTPPPPPPPPPPPARSACAHSPAPPLPPPPAGAPVGARPPPLACSSPAPRAAHRQRLVVAAAASGGDDRPPQQPLHGLGRSLLSGLMGVAAAAALLGGTPLDAAMARTALTADERATIQLFQRSRPSVVYITSLTARWVAGWAGACWVLAAAAGLARARAARPAAATAAGAPSRSALRLLRLGPQAGQLHHEPSRDPAGRGVGCALGCCRAAAALRML